jgi:hypothetical protein
MSPCTNDFTPCRPCYLTPLHSLTGLVGQPFASRLGGSVSRPGDAQTHNGTVFLLLVLSRYNIFSRVQEIVSLSFSPKPIPFIV